MPELTCQELVELVTDYLDEALDPETARRFDEHVADCPGCQTYVEQLRETASRLGTIPADSLPEEMQAALRAAFRDLRR